MKHLMKLWIRLSVLLGMLRRGVVRIPEGSMLILQSPQHIPEAEMELLKARLAALGVRAILLDGDVKLAGFIERPDIQVVCDVDLVGIEDQWRRATSAPGAAAEPARRPARPPRSSAAGAQGGSLRRGKEKP